MLLNLWLISTEKPWWYTHDDALVRKPILLSLQQQVDKNVFHAGRHLLMCFPNLSKMQVKTEQIFLTLYSFAACLCLPEAARFMTYKKQSSNLRCNWKWHFLTKFGSEWWKSRIQVFFCRFKQFYTISIM